MMRPEASHIRRPRVLTILKSLSDIDMEGKPCRKCHAWKPLSAYYVHRGMRDGYLNICKDCVRKRVRTYRERHDSVRVYDRSRAQLPHRVQQRQQYNNTFRHKYPDVRRAEFAVDNALRDGRLHKAAACESCGASGVFLEGAHSDYSKPLVVRWLCRRCHRKWDAEYSKTVGLSRAQARTCQ